MYNNDVSSEVEDEIFQDAEQKNVFLEDLNQDIGRSKVEKNQKINVDKNDQEKNQQHEEISPQQNNSENIQDIRNYKNQQISPKKNKQLKIENTNNQEHQEISPKFDKNIQIDDTNNQQNDFKDELTQQHNQNMKTVESRIVIGHRSNHIIHENQSEPNDQIKKQIKILLSQLQRQLSDLLKKNKNQNEKSKQNDDKMKILQQQIQILQIRLRLFEKMKKQKDITSIDRISHFDHIFKHYCTQIFKTGKHMTFDRLEYEKNHLTIDRFFIFLKDFNLTSMKTKDGKTKEIVDKQEVIKLFKKLSPNCRDLSFQQFIIIIQKLAEIYFDSMINHEERKRNERIQRLKIKQTLQKKEKYKQQMLKRHKEKIQSLQRIVQTVDNLEQKIEPPGEQNDNLVKQLMEKTVYKGHQNNEIKEKTIQKSNISQKSHLTDSKIKKSITQYPKTFKKSPVVIQQKNPCNHPLLILSKEEKREYFYEIINIDNVQNFINKLRELNLPLFKIYASQNDKEKGNSQQKKRDQRTDVVFTANTQQQEEEKRIRELRQKLNERNQKLKHLSAPILSKQQYEQRKLQRSRMLQQELMFGPGVGSSKDKKKSRNKIDLSSTEINLQSLSKLSYQNVNFTKFDPRNLYSKEEDDKIFLKQYDIDSPVKVRKLTKNFTQLSRIGQNSKRAIEQQSKSPISILEKLKQRQAQIQINQKNQQVSQMYRLNDRTQRQKKLIDKFLEKNR